MVQRMLGTIDTHVMNRIAAVTASLMVYVPHDHPNRMVELWEYPKITYGLKVGIHAGRNGDP